MDATKIQQITQMFLENKNLTSEEVMNGFIFGTYGDNEHYLIDEIEKIRNTVLTLTAPAVVEAPVENIEPIQEPELTLEEQVKAKLINDGVIQPDPVVEEVLPIIE